MSEVRVLGKAEKPIRKGIKGKLLSAAFEAYEMPDFTLPSLQLRGNREVCIEGCRGILEYDEGRIRLNCGRLVIGFVGDGIEITAYSDIQTVITGNIFSVEFEGAGD